jgi:hypothetical protein|tara:strand:+ start:9103 stop:9630 length:528 start_codon:yes stop_codon:yes gene_type:complete
MEKIKEILPDIVKDIKQAIVKQDFSRFKGLRIDRREPHTLRLFYYREDGLRVCFHIFQPCAWEDAFPHPHSWDSEVLIVKGSYIHWVSDHTPLSEKCNETKGFKHILSSGSSYSIDNPYVWHKVQPLEEVMTLMVNSEAWETQSDYCVTTKGKELVKLTESEIHNMLVDFHKYIK